MTTLLVTIKLRLDILCDVVFTEATYHNKLINTSTTM